MGSTTFFFEFASYACVQTPPPLHKKWSLSQICFWGRGGLYTPQAKECHNDLNYSTFA